jgi:hypothetical protein
VSVIGFSNVSVVRPYTFIICRLLSYVEYLPNLMLEIAYRIMA